MALLSPAYIAATIFALWIIKALFLDSLILSPLRKIPGPKAFALTKWRLAYEDWNGSRTRCIDRLHRQYGPVVRIGPNEVSFNSLDALRTIYGPGSRFGRTNFYRMFDVYGKQNLFTFHSPAEHGQRKKLLSHAYAKSTMLKEPITTMVEDKVLKFLNLIKNQPDLTSDVFRTLHYYSLDSITAFLYGKHGSTAAMEGVQAHRDLIGDILDPARRRLSWFAVHWPALTKWLYTRTGAIERLVRPFLPMQKPSTYTGIRAFALEAYNRFRNAKQQADVVSSVETVKEPSILAQLWRHHQTQTSDGLDDLDMASEVADHLLAGIDTTSDTLMFLIWSLSQAKNLHIQERLRQEVLNLSDEALTKSGVVKVGDSDKCAYLNAVIKETLRLYAPLPSFEPRSMATESIIDGYVVPGNTVVGMAPYTMHRNPAVFKDVNTFNPDRWLGSDAQELDRWFWAFSSGGRMCIGLHLAMAEMTTLVAALYRRFETTLPEELETVTPGITARFELFYDDQFPRMEEHCCMIRFRER